MGGKNIVFLKNHGILVAADTVARAYKYLYKMERVCRAQVLALSTGRELNILSREVVDAVNAPALEESHSSEERERLFFEAMMRIVDRELPGYRG
jgi:ribulose-5-phosphate 4-epimerase/fuculose-1-phosphate aldolase